MSSRPPTQVFLVRRDQLVSLGTETLLVDLSGSKTPKFPDQFFVLVDEEEDEKRGIDDTNGLRFRADLNFKWNDPFLTMGTSDILFCCTMALVRAIGTPQ